jgi:hypothetical protein
VAPPPSKTSDRCPYQQILDLYHEILPELARVRAYGDRVKAQVRARWTEDTARQTVDWWREFFLSVRAMPFLMGCNDRQWRTSFLWLVKPENMAKVLNGAYEPKDAQLKRIEAERPKKPKIVAPPVEWPETPEETAWLDRLEAEKRLLEAGTDETEVPGGTDPIPD